MEQNQYNQLFSFIWNIATDVLVYAFDKGEYKKIIMHNENTEFCRNYLDNPDFMNFINQRVFNTAYENANK